MVGVFIHSPTNPRYPLNIEGEEVDIDKEAKEITKQMYMTYGTDTGILFGIPANLRLEVEAVVKVVLKHPRVSIKEKE